MPACGKPSLIARPLAEKFAPAFESPQTRTEIRPATALKETSTRGTFDPVAPWTTTEDAVVAVFVASQATHQGKAPAWRICVGGSTAT
jgi:hypothetical protein